MGADGLAQGELREGEAFDPVRALSRKGMRDRLGLITGGEPEPYPAKAEFETDLETMRLGLAHAARHGITFIQNMDGNVYTLELLEELHRRRRAHRAGAGAVPLQELHGPARCWRRPAAWRRAMAPTCCPRAS